ncbi:MAG TPA: hypothetical protein VIV11_17670 [Kofleriaceae bacterium]
MRNIWVALVCAALAACGSDGKDNGGSDANNTGPDAKQFLDAPATMNAMITVSGQATVRDVNGATPTAGVTIAAYRNSDENTPIAMTTSDAQGMYSLTIQTNGEALDGFLKATLSGHKTTYLYPPYPLGMDFNMASVIMVTPMTYDTLSTFSQANHQPGKALVALIVTDGVMNPIAGATVSSNPAAMPPARYNAVLGGTIVGPSVQATSTYTDGIAYLFNLPPGQVMVSAMKAPMTFKTHSVKGWADELVTTVIVP